MSISRKLRTVAAAGAVAAASLALSAPASARPASSPESLTFLTSGAIHVTSSTGKHLLLSLSATRFARNQGGSNAHRPSTLQVTLRGNSGHEIHQWSFALAANSFTDVAGGSGTLKTGGQIAPYGRLSLAISPLSARTTQVCNNANHNQVHRVALKGTLSFLTHSPGPDSWGKLASSAVDFTQGRLSAGHGPDIEEACTVTPCLAGVSWTASHGNLDLAGMDVARKGHKPVSRIEGSRVTPLSAPAHAIRFDTVMVKAPPPTLTTAGGVVTLAATSSGAIATGSGRAISNHHSAYRQTCATGRIVGTSWTATYDAGTPRLTFHEQIFGPLTVAVDKQAVFSKVHLT